MNRYDADFERGRERERQGGEPWEHRRSGREGQRFENEGRRFENETWERGDYGRERSGEGGRFERPRYERFESQGYGDQGAYGQPYGQEYRSQDWDRQFGRENREGYGRQFGGRFGNFGESEAERWRGQELGRHTGRGPKTYHRSDQRIMEDVCDRLTDHPGIDATEIEVKVNNGEVTLSGSVDERHIKRMAEDIVENVSGVKDVHNQIRVQQESGKETTGGRKSASSQMNQQYESTGTRR